MARRVSKRKRQEREEYMFKEREKIDTGIFDTRTMIYLSKFFNKHIIDRLRYPVARGKEADLYLATSGVSDKVKNTKFVILKFFRVETTSFFKMNDYIIGDPRFTKISKSKGEIIGTWCKKEYGNLNIAEMAHVNAPRPYMFNGSILAMQFIGDDNGIPMPQLKQSVLENPEKVFDEIIEMARRLYRNNLVHADLSEFNVLMKNEVPYMIDFGQAVVLKHPNAMKFLKRDLYNILQYFKKSYGIEKDLDKTLSHITS